MIKLNKKDILNHVKVEPNKGFENWYSIQLDEEIKNCNRLLGELLRNPMVSISSISADSTNKYGRLQDVENGAYNVSLVAKIMSDKVKQLKVNNTPAGVR